MRKTDIVRIPAGSPDENRDQGKVYLLTEMSAAKAEKWAARAVLALAAQGVSDAEPNDGMAGLAGINTEMLGRLSFDVIEPLMDEMMECVGFVGDETKTDQVTNLPFSRPLSVDSDVEEVQTRILLRARLVDLHTGFSVSAFLSRLGAAAKAKISSTLDTSTSPTPSGSSSEAS